MTETSAISLVELILICTMTGVPSCDTTTEDGTKETDIGVCVNMELLPPQPIAISAVPPKKTPIRTLDPSRMTVRIKDSFTIELEVQIGARQNAAGFMIYQKSTIVLNRNRDKKAIAEASMPS
jgi:hypothetical protein